MNNFDKRLSNFIENLDNKSVFKSLDDLKAEIKRLEQAVKISEKAIEKLTKKQQLKL